MTSSKAHQVLMSGGDELEKPLNLPDGVLALNIHTIAEATVDEVVHEAVQALTQAVAGATQWLTDAVRGELISLAVSDNGLETLRLLARTGRSNTVVISAEETIQPMNRTPSSTIHAVAKATVDAVTEEAVKDIVQAVEMATEWISRAVENELVSSCLDPNEDIAFHNATEWITQAVRSELIAHAVADAVPSGTCTPSEEQATAGALEVATTHDVPRLSLPGCESIIANACALAKLTAEEAVTKALEDVEEPQQPPPTTDESDVSLLVPALQIPNTAGESSKTAEELVTEVLSIKTPQPAHVTLTTDMTTTRLSIHQQRKKNRRKRRSHQLVRQTRTRSPFHQFSCRDRRQSPITSKRGLGTPRLKEDSPSSAPPAIPSSLIIDETPTELSVSSHSTLPPLILPGVQPTARSKPHQHETPRKTSRQSSSGSNAGNEVKSSRSCSAKVDKLTSRASTTAELELTPMSSARAAALIYTQQPPSSRRHHHHHHHHKPKKVRDYASQTSPPPSPPSSSLPLQPLLGTHRDSNGSELSRTNSKHSPRDQSPLENGIEQKSDGGNSTLFAPLSTTPAISPSAGSSPAKSSSPSRTRRSHGHGHSHKGHSDPSPNKRSGYCPRCVFEGRSCKISDCLKHQVLK
ncbi:hypothetical protein GQ600_2775 [Phytophthora cactorum]|nr:hypothetical protein GQ600_2775 [Phytophthora cactorum]